MPVAYRCQGSHAQNLSGRQVVHQQVASGLALQLCGIGLYLDTP